LLFDVLYTLVGNLSGHRYSIKELTVRERHQMNLVRQ
jgi:hypothetical protein